MSLTREQQEHDDQIRDLAQRVTELQREVRLLAAAVHDLRLEMARDRERAAHEREMLVLRLENALLRPDSGLPPADQ